MSSLTPVRRTTPTTPESLSQMFDLIVIEEQPRDYIEETVSCISIQSMTEPEIEETFAKCSLEQLQLMINELSQEVDVNSNSIVTKILIKEIGNRNISDEELLGLIGCSEKSCNHFLNPSTMEQTLQGLINELHKITKNVELYHNALPDQIVDRATELILTITSMEDYARDRTSISYALEETLKALIEVEQFEKNQNCPLQYEIIKISTTLLSKIQKSINPTELYKRFESYKNDFYKLLELIKISKPNFVNKICSSPEFPHILSKTIRSINLNSEASFFKELITMSLVIDPSCLKLQTTTLLLLSGSKNRQVRYKPTIKSSLCLEPVDLDPIDHLFFLLKNLEPLGPEKGSILRTAITNLHPEDTVKFLIRYCDTPHDISQLLSSSLGDISKKTLTSLSIQAAHKADLEMNSYEISKLVAISKGTLRLLNSEENIKEIIPSLSDTSRYRILISLLPDSIFPTSPNDSDDVQKIAERVIADYHSNTLKTLIQRWEKQLPQINNQVQNISEAFQNNVSIESALIYKKKIDELLKSLLNPESGCLMLLRGIHIANCAIIEQPEMNLQVNCVLISHLLKSLEKHREIHAAYTTSKQYKQFCFWRKNRYLLSHINDMIHPVIVQAQEIYKKIVSHTPEFEGLLVKSQRILQAPSEPADPDDEKIMLLDSFIKRLCREASPYSLTEALLDQHNLSWKKISDCFMPLPLEVVKKTLKTLINLAEVSLFCSENLPEHNA